MVQDITNVNGVKTLVSDIKFQKITSVSLFWRNYLNRLVQPKLSNIQKESNQLIFRRILNICFCIHHFLLQRAKFSYRQLIQPDTNIMKSKWLLYVWKESVKCYISMKIRTTVMSCTSSQAFHLVILLHIIIALLRPSQRWAVVGGWGMGGYLFLCSPEKNRHFSLFPKIKILIFCVPCSPKLPLFPCSLCYPVRLLFPCSPEINDLFPLFLKPLAGYHHPTKQST